MIVAIVQSFRLYWSPHYSCSPCMRPVHPRTHRVLNMQCVALTCPSTRFTWEQDLDLSRVLQPPRCDPLFKEPLRKSIAGALHASKDCRHLGLIRKHLRPTGLSPRSHVLQPPQPPQHVTIYMLTKVVSNRRIARSRPDNLASEAVCPEASLVHDSVP